jgi:hypothetical protein
VGFIQPPLFESSITGRVYNYYDDVPYQGETVELYSGPCSGTPVLTEVTTSNGNYFFDYIPAGDYCVRVLTGLTMYSTGGPAQASVSLPENDYVIVDFDLDGSTFSPTETPTP